MLALVAELAWVTSGQTGLGGAKTDSKLAKMTVNALTE